MKRSPKPGKEGAEEVRPLRQIAQALNASFLLDGSIQWQRDGWLIHVGRIDGASGFKCWAQSHRRAHVFALKADFARERARGAAARAGADARCQLIHLGPLPSAVIPSAREQA